ncbi:four-helix bundle copper-binding protein [Citricoccus nitrophenolicus]|uniref:four-helix bundle copper-binding protein n=1 Tax=Citricoccus nitrophenolicus TaxID=863575 RepID=UPI0031EE0EF7
MTHHVSSMLETYPKDLGNIDRQKLDECIQACFECAQTCTACADACLAEDMVAELTRCIRLNLDCADICEATGRVLSRQTGNNAEVTRSLLAACRDACTACGEECAQHADMHGHCKVCAEACRRCEQACTELLASLV